MIGDSIAAPEPTPMHAPSSRTLTFAFAALAIGLLVMTLAWHIPMMLWDPLDLLPILQAWRHGDWLQSDFLRMHGGHIHTAAYAVLLVTTTASHATAWVDCVTSWLLLIAAAALLSVALRETLARGVVFPTLLPLLAVLLLLHPGHLANLQWGWQVAVFLCLLGVAGTIIALTRPTLDAKRNVIALACTLLACTSFATGLAMLPVALVLIGLRRELPRSRRMTLALPWAIALALAIGLRPRLGTPIGLSDAPLLATYMLNFIGAGIARFATDLAPWLAALGILSACAMAIRLRAQREALPWMGLTAFAIVASGLVAIARAPSFGADHAFVTRYVSFSTLFWLGWTGMLASLHSASSPRLMQVGAIMVFVFAAANGLHMIHKASQVGARTGDIAATIARDYPDIDSALLREVHFDREDTAAERIRMLHDLGYPPFRVP